MLELEEEEEEEEEEQSSSRSTSVRSASESFINSTASKSLKRVGGLHFLGCLSAIFTENFLTLDRLTKLFFQGIKIAFKTMIECRFPM